VHSNAAIDELERTCNECVALVHEWAAIANLQGQPESVLRVIRQMLVPVLYSAWERAFVASTSVSLRFLISHGERNADLGIRLRALLMQSASFYKSFFQKHLNSLVLTGENAGKGAFTRLAEFAAEHDRWLASRPSFPASGVEELVMTFSNVDHKVLKLHLELLGMDTADLRVADSVIDLQPLGTLIGRRNDISHGGLISDVGTAELQGLLEFVPKLISAYIEAQCRLVRNHAAREARMTFLKRRRDTQASRATPVRSLSSVHPRKARAPR
jgi:hypothetical protein